MKGIRRLPFFCSLLLLSALVVPGAFAGARVVGGAVTTTTFAGPHPVCTPPSILLIDEGPGIDTFLGSFDIEGRRCFDPGTLAVTRITAILNYRTSGDEMRVNCADTHNVLDLPICIAKNFAPFECRGRVVAGPNFGKRIRVFADAQINQTACNGYSQPIHLEYEGETIP